APPKKGVFTVSGIHPSRTIVVFFALALFFGPAFVPRSDSAGAEDRNSPLPAAGKEGRCEELLRLMEEGADLGAAKENEGLTPLILAASGGHLETVRCLLDRGVDVNATDKFGSTALIRASAKGHIEVVRLLLDRGARVNATSGSGTTALIKAALLGHSEVSRELLDRGADVNVTVQNTTTITLLMMACNISPSDVVELLVERGADVKASAEDGQTALLDAVTNGRSTIVKLLLEKGADANHRHAMGYTPLILAHLENWVDIADLLKSKGAKVQPDDMLAMVVMGTVDEVAGLLQRGADVNARVPKWGTTMLMHAAWAGRTDMAAFLLDRGAEVDVTSDSGQTAQSLACDHGRPKVLELLLKRGADPNRKVVDEETPLFFAVRPTARELRERLWNRSTDRDGSESGVSGQSQVLQRQRRECIQLLLAGGADVNIANNRGATPLMTACEWGGTEEVNLLLEKGADVTRKDHEGATALSIATRGKHTDIVKALRDRGAEE
ncbi:MAG: ankyrin repeat domain-containing protein, partial [Pseudomonadota bacterium]